MTVQQLTAYLATLPQDAQVVLAGPDGDATPVVGAYGHAHDARHSLTDRMGDLERAEFWALFGLLGEFRHVARAALGVTP